MSRAAVLGAVVLFSSLSLRAIEPLPVELSDEQFWRIVSESSEKDGYFDSDNLVSNETGFQSVIPTLLRLTKPGGVYVGVGPEQNFTYIASLQPKIAFIVDIRRQNLLQLLMYKALFEVSSDRADFLGRLLSRQRPSGLDRTSTATDLMDAYSRVSPDANLRERNLRAVLDRLANVHKFPLSADDNARIAYVMNAFFEKGVDVTYVNPGSPNARQARLATLMTATDAGGQARGFLATEENFRIVQNLQKRNLIVPLTGDFAGDKAIRSIGEYLSKFDAKVTVFYTSNVERYLFGTPRAPSDAWKRFYANVAALPLDESSTFIRTGANVEQSVLGSIPKLVVAYRDGKIQRYADIPGQ